MVNKNLEDNSTLTVSKNIDKFYNSKLYLERCLVKLNYNDSIFTLSIFLQN